MNRRQRALHARLWVVLAILIAGLFAAALIVRDRTQSAHSESGGNPHRHYRHGRSRAEIRPRRQYSEFGTGSA